MPGHRRSRARRLASAGFATLRLKLLPAGLAPLARLRRRDRLIAASPPPEHLAGLALGPRIALFCQYDRTGTLSPATLVYLRALAACGFDIVVVSNAGRLTQEAWAALRDIAVAVLLRANSGYDFAAWAEALRRLALPRPQTQALLLVNDSVLGPIGPLRPVLDRLDPKAADIWGLTDSTQLGWHLQSYFLLAGPRALHSPAWADFWARVRPAPWKRMTIWGGEIAFSQRLRQSGLRLAALWPSAPDGQAPPNPTTDRWRELLAAGFPFLKKEVLRDDPGRTGAAAGWAAAVAGCLPTDPAVLAAMAAEAGRGRAGHPKSGNAEPGDQASARR